MWFKFIVFSSIFSSVSFALQPKEIRQAVLKERIKAGQDRRDIRWAWIQKRNPADSQFDRLYFRVPLGSEFISLCLNAFKNLFGIFRRQWEYLKRNCSGSYIAGPILHGNVGTQHRRRSSAVVSAAPSVIAFLQDVSTNYAEPYATRFIREITGMSLREDEEGAVELPSSFTKRKLYAEYCFSRGYKVKADAKGSYGKMQQYEERAIDDMLWPEGSVPLPVCSWKDFLKLWKQHFPQLSIRNPCEDTCGECAKYRNSFRLLDKIGAARRSHTARLQESLNPDSDNSTGDNSDVEVSPDNQLEYDFLSQQEYPEEVIIMEASIHATRAQNQRVIANLRIEESKNTRGNEWEDRRFVPPYCYLIVCSFFVIKTF